ncbi:hypothetical protein AB0N05_08750 [Nocardia sp. NPDC051030]|uniref:hypothetical protein n=1 Tax=Nocardia sp. NPDC051030 TaxID=3155162 RepID=UPI00343E0DB7
MNDVLWPPVPMWHRAVPGRVGPPPLVWLIGVHGGAGVTSLAASLRWAGDAGRRWPGRIGLVRDMDSPLMVLVARTHMSGLVALENALNSYMHQATPAGSLVVGVVTVADAARPLPNAVARKHAEIEVLAREVGAPVWRLPWIEQWRGLEPHELAVWSPTAITSPTEDADATRTPPQPIRHFAEQLFAAARATGALLLDQSTDDQPSDNQPPGSRSTGNQPSGTQPSGSRSSDNQPSGSRSSDNQPSGTQPSGSRSTDNLPSNSRPSDNRSTGTQPIDNRSTGTQPIGSRFTGTQSSNDATTLDSDSVHTASRPASSAASSVHSGSDAVAVGNHATTSGNDAGRAGSSPRRFGNDTGQLENFPTQSGNSPEQSGTATGQSERSSGQSERSSGHSGRHAATSGTPVLHREAG